MLLVEHNLKVVSGLCDTITVLTRGRVLAEGDYAAVSPQPGGRRPPISAPRPKEPPRMAEAGGCRTGTRRAAAPRAGRRCWRSRGLEAWYGESHILHGVDLEVAPGEVVTLLGRNGAGKTTTLRADHGPGRAAQRQRSATRARRLIDDRSDLIARAGIGFCPEERGIFASPRRDREPDAAARSCSRAGSTSTTIYALFPNLKERARSPGTKLSGGEQQMLAIARILRTGAKLLLLDEPSEGLAPVIVQQIGRTIREIKQRGFTVLLVEQNFRFAQTVADRHYVMEHGRVVDMVPNSELDRLAWTGCTNTSASDAAPARRIRTGNTDRMTIDRRTLLKAARRRAGRWRALPGGGGLPARRAQANTIKIGVLNDMSGLYRDITGPTSVACVRAGRAGIRRPRRLQRRGASSADHQNRPDVGSNVARQWFDRDGVDVIVDVPTSSVALAVTGIAQREEQGLPRTPPRPPPT